MIANILNKWFDKKSTEELMRIASGETFDTGSEDEQIRKREALKAIIYWNYLTYAVELIAIFAAVKFALSETFFWGVVFSTLFLSQLYLHTFSMRTANSYFLREIYILKKKQVTESEK